MLKNGTKFVWSEEAETAFLDIKSRLTSRPILRPPDFSRPFCIAVDASDVARRMSISGHRRYRTSCCLPEKEIQQPPEKNYLWLKKRLLLSFWQHVHSLSSTLARL